MENGSLAECLMGKVCVCVRRGWGCEEVYIFAGLFFLQRRISLLWNVRLKIANQIADALHFLHTVNQPKCLVHGDVKR